MRPFSTLSLLVVSFTCGGCMSPYHTDRGALLGGLTGAGAGALIGNAVGNTTGGALAGAGIGAIAGSMIGAGVDESEARTRAEIQQQIGRALPPGGVTVGDAISMSRAGVDPELIVNHIRANGVAQSLAANDLIALQQQGIDRRVIDALQTTPRPQVAAGGPPHYVAAPAYVAAPPPYVYYPYYAPPPPPPPPVAFGFSYSKRR